LTTTSLARTLAWGLLSFTMSEYQIEHYLRWVEDEAIIGYDHRGLLVYSYEKMLDVLMQDMTKEEAVKWIDCNFINNGGAGFTLIYQ